MTNLTSNVFAQVHGTLLQTYVRLQSDPTNPDIDAVRSVLAQSRQIVANTDDAKAHECFVRYLKLISLGLDDPSIEDEFAFSDPNAQPTRKTVTLGGGAAVEGNEANTKRILVSGIGRSGTTMIYQQIAKLLLMDGLDTNFRYEPYLWNIQSSATEGNKFDMSQLHQFGLQSHLETPLVLDGPHDAHDPFVDHLFAEPSDRINGAMPDAYLTKVIRGSGRLRSYIKRFPDLKVIACLRNPFDTLNSSLGMFSFFGEEFHADDRARFRAELSSRGLPVDHLSMDSPRAIEWYAAWWRTFTEETLAAARAFPDNFYLFCYEDFRMDMARVFDEMQTFIGVRNPGINMGLSRPAGPSIKATSLTAWDVSHLSQHHSYYEQDVLRPLMSETDVARLRPDLVGRYARGKFSFPVAGSELGQMAPIQLRGMMLNGASSPTATLVSDPRTPVDLTALITKHAGDKADAVRTPTTDVADLKVGKTFGVVLTCHNNADTIVDAVQSCLNQTLPFDEIIVVDDASSDASREKLTLLAAMYSAVRLRFLESALGPSSARHIGITTLDTDFWCQLDGDDLFWPTKLEGEARALDGDPRKVAFSDILLVGPKGSVIQNTQRYASDQQDVFHALLGRHPQIPRDMTLSRDLYFEAGGYNFMSHLYEDWDFKMRLASLGGTQWCRADGIAGTVYNRLSPGLSGAEPGLHARALVRHFLSAVGHYCPAPGKVLAAFDTTTKNFKDRHVTKSSRKILIAALDRGPEALDALASIVTSRQAHVLDNADFIKLLDEHMVTTQPVDAVVQS